MEREVAESKTGALEVGDPTDRRQTAKEPAAIGHGQDLAAEQSCGRRGAAHRENHIREFDEPGGVEQRGEGAYEANLGNGVVSERPESAYRG